MIKDVVGVLVGWLAWGDRPPLAMRMERGVVVSTTAPSHFLRQCKTASNSFEVFRGRRESFDCTLCPSDSQCEWNVKDGEAHVIACLDQLNTLLVPTYHRMNCTCHGGAWTKSNNTWTCAAATVVTSAPSHRTGANSRLETPCGRKPRCGL